MVGASHVRLGEDVPYRPEAWEGGGASRARRGGGAPPGRGGGGAGGRGGWGGGGGGGGFFSPPGGGGGGGAGPARPGRFLPPSSFLAPLAPPLERLRRELG